MSKPSFLVKPKHNYSLRTGQQGSSKQARGRWPLTSLCDVNADFNLNDELLRPFLHIWNRDFLQYFIAK